MSNRRWKW